MVAKLAERNINDVDRLQVFKSLKNLDIPGQETCTLSLVSDPVDKTWSYRFSVAQRNVYESGSLTLGHGEDFRAYRDEYLAQLFCRPESYANPQAREKGEALPFGFLDCLDNEAISLTRRLSIFSELQELAWSLASTVNLPLRKIDFIDQCCYQIWAGDCFLYESNQAPFLTIDLQKKTKIFINAVFSNAFKRQTTSFQIGEYVFRSETQGIGSSALAKNARASVQHADCILTKGGGLPLSKEALIPAGAETLGTTPRVRLALSALQVLLFQASDAYRGILSAPESQRTGGIGPALTLREAIEGKPNVVPSISARPISKVDFQVTVNAGLRMKSHFLIQAQRLLPSTDDYKLKVRLGLCASIDATYRQSLKYINALEKTVMYAELHKMDFSGVSLGQLFAAPKPGADEIRLAFGGDETKF